MTGVSPSVRQTSSSRTDWGTILAAAVIAWFAWIMFRSGNAPVVGDYGEWTYHGVLLRDVLQGHPDPLYSLKHYPVPNSLTTVALGLMMLVLPWVVASKLWLLVVATFGLFSARTLQRAAGSISGARTLVFPAAVFFGSAFWYGFINFLLGTYFAMLCCAWLLSGRRSRWVLALLLVLAFFSHMIPFTFAVLLVVLYALQALRWALLWQTLPASLLTLWYLAGRAAHGNVDGQAGMTASVSWGTAAFAAFKVNTLLKSWGFINPAGTPSDSVLLALTGAKLFLLLFAVNAVLAVVLLWWMARSGRAAIVARDPMRFFWIAVAVFLVVGIVLPGAAGGVSDPGGRMLQTALWCAVCIVPLAGRLSSRIVAVCATMLLAADCFLFAAAGVAPMPIAGADGGPLPARVRQFAHVFYTSRWQDYGDIAAGRMNDPIWPTAMFVERDPIPATTQKESAP